MSIPEDLTVDHIEVDVEEVERQEYSDGVFVRAIRFKAGEEVVCGVHVEDFDWTVKKFVVIHQPMVIDATGKMVPWTSIGNAYSYTIATDLIRSMYEVKHKFMDQWNHAAEEQHFGFLRDDLADPDLPDEEREAIEQELAEADDGSVDQEIEPPEMFGYMPVSKTRH